MVRVIAVVFALAIATSAQAMSPPPLHQRDGIITQVREACGAGRVRINGAWPEPLPAMSAEKSAGVRDGMETFALTITNAQTC